MFSVINVSPAPILSFIHSSNRGPFVAQPLNSSESGSSKRARVSTQTQKEASNAKGKGKGKGKGVASLPLYVAEQEAAANAKVPTKKKVGVVEDEYEWVMAFEACQRQGSHLTLLSCFPASLIRDLARCAHCARRRRARNRHAKRQRVERALDSSRRSHF